MKKINYISFLLFSVFLSCSVQKQKAETNFKKIKGIVVDKYAYESIPGAKIKIINKSKTERKTYTDLHGNFEIEVKKGEVLEISFIGCYSERIVIDDSDEYKIKLSWNDGSRDKRRQRDLRRLARKNGGSYIIPD